MVLPGGAAAVVRLDATQEAATITGQVIAVNGGLVQVDSSDIVTLVNQIMIDEFEVEAGSISPKAQLGEDLGLDSLDGVDLVVALEKTFQCRIPEDEARSIRTMGDIYDRVESGLAKA